MTIILPTFPVMPTRELADRVVRTTHEQYTALPSHGKPMVRSNGVPEWTILASISLIIPPGLAPLPRVKVSPRSTPNSSPSRSAKPLPSLRRSTSSSPKTTPSNLPLPSVPSSLPSSHTSTYTAQTGQEPCEPRVALITLATGVKCLPANRLPPLGDTLHDSHAEVLSRRGFVHWLLHESQAVLRGQKNMGVIAWDGERLRLRDEVKVVLYVSALPCGDASTLHTAAHQPAEMAALKASNVGIVPSVKPGAALRGRNGYDNYGAIRTKPGRADSIPTTSLSCSDKIASWNVLGLQGGLLADLFDPVYLDLVVIGGVEEEAPEGFDANGNWHERIGREVNRALCRRMTGIEGRLPPPYHLHRPEVYLTKPAPAVVSLSHIAPTGHAGHVIHNGARQGGPWRPPGFTPIVPKSRSMLCKLELMRSYLETLSLARPNLIQEDQLYYDLKHTRTSLYQVAKSVLRGQPLVPVPPPFDIYVPTSCLSTCAGGNGTGGSPPFRGWIVTGAAFESFTQDGTLVDADGSLRETILVVQASRKTKVDPSEPISSASGTASELDVSEESKSDSSEPKSETAGVVDTMKHSLGAVGANITSAVQRDIEAAE
ncbi:hypothetical protein Q5752_000088 [Cryptotrichosporon argae]